jgi:hypothetical protein
VGVAYSVTAHLHIHRWLVFDLAKRHESPLGLVKIFKAALPSSDCGTVKNKIVGQKDEKRSKKSEIHQVTAISISFFESKLYSPERIEYFRRAVRETNGTCLAPGGAPQKLFETRAQLAGTELFLSTKILHGRKVTDVFSRIKITVSLLMPIHSCPQLASTKSNAYPLFLFTSYS